MTAPEARAIIRGMVQRRSITRQLGDELLADLARSPSGAAEIVRLARGYAL